VSFVVEIFAFCWAFTVPPWWTNKKPAELCASAGLDSCVCAVLTQPHTPASAFCAWWWWWCWFIMKL